VLLQTGYHGAHINGRKKIAEPHHWDIPPVKSQFAKSTGKEEYNKHT
jgi:hypothetical protein